MGLTVLLSPRHLPLAVLLVLFAASIAFIGPLFSSSPLRWHEQAMSALASLQFLTVAARAKHTATVIFVHGLGDTGHGWKPVADMFGRDPALQHVKWVLPHAPIMAVTANMGMKMPSWFDIYSFDLVADDEKGMLQTVHSLNKLITDEVDSGIPAERVILGGFSQGGAMSLLTGLTTERKLGGVIVLSGWLPMRQKFKAMVSDHVKKLPLFWGHGQSDPLVKYSLGTSSIEYLKSEVGLSEAGLSEAQAKPVGITFNSYPGMQHSTCEEELDALQKWISQVVPESFQS